MRPFGNKDKSESREGGLMDVIRCDESDYLIWKWQPAGAADTTRKENAIRWGSSLRVKDGEVAVFVYRQKDGTQQDFIVGPFDETIKTANFPVLASIIGAAFGGGTPFQAEVYFINLAGIIQIKFAVPYFDVFDPRFVDFAVPVAVRGTISFKIADYKTFITLHRLISFDLEQFKSQVQDAVKKYVKGIVANCPADNQIVVTQMDKKILQINELAENYIQPRLAADFGVTVSAVDIGEIDIDKASDGYRQLMAVTKDIQSQTIKAQTDMNLENMAETLRIQREEGQHATRMQTDAANIAVHQINQQTKVGMAGAAALGQMGAAGGTGINLGSGGGFNPAGMMAGMAMGSAIGQNMAGMMNGALGGVQQPAMQQNAGSAVPPPPPVSAYHLAVNGQGTGPYTVDTLRQMVLSNQFNAQSLVWKAGMANWAPAGTVAELAGLFAQSVPPVPRS